MDPNRGSLRRWQEEALERWRSNGNRGIVEVVTGGGKTYFALACIRAASIDTVVIVVPSITLVDQWWEEASANLGLHLDEINIVSSKRGFRSGTINIVVMNTAAQLTQNDKLVPCFLIVDECHRVATPEFRHALKIPSLATLGLSATPQRDYDSGLEDVLIPTLGSVIYEYTYEDALRDGVIVPFTLHNVIFELEPEVETQYNRLTLAIGRAIEEFGAGSEETVRLLLKRARVQNQSLNRVRHATRIAAHHSSERVLIFFEDIPSAELSREVLSASGVRCAVYHSRMSLRKRAETLANFRSGDISVLVSCRALDEGFNVPETRVGIVAAGTATRRQRIQRLGRALRPSSGKRDAIIYTLVATKPELRRLETEAREMGDFVNVIWSQADP